MSITIYIIIITVAVSLISFSRTDIFSKLTFSPYEISHRRQYWRFFSCALLHGDFFHLFINMFVLYSFGLAVERYYSFIFGNASTIIFLLLYISSVGAANVFSYYKHQNNSSFISVGASGAVSAIVFVSILFDPYRPLYLYGLIGIPGILLGIGYLIYSYYMSNKGTDNIDHNAHLYGAIYGMLFTIVFKPSLFLAFVFKLLGN
jgi:membrane associated rhomboid family serine protease